MMNYVCIGDVHGCADQLRKLIDKLSIFSDCRYVFMGDYVDIGPDSKGVIDILIEFKREHPDSLFIKGNHEVEMLNYIASGDFLRYAKKGGIPSIRSYSNTSSGDLHKTFVESIPKDHLDFLMGLNIYHESDDILFSHAGLDPLNSADRSQYNMTCKSHATLLTTDLTLPKLVVCGHYFQSSHQPLLRDNLIAVDSGCGVIGGPLSAVFLPSRQVVQA